MAKIFMLKAVQNMAVLLLTPCFDKFKRRNLSLVVSDFIE